MKTKSRLWVWIAVGLFSATGWAGAEQDLGINALTDVPEVEGKIAENLARVEHAQTRQAQIDTEISGLADKRQEAEGGCTNVRVPSIAFGELECFRLRAVSTR